MGKKSRLKRERRAAKLEDQKAISPQDIRFERTCNELKALFSNYNASDILISLTISDLWIPNISSQVKHALTFAVSISMTADSFKGKVRIESYSDFQEFLRKVYTILPSFPMLEDYIPEADWGEIKFAWKDSLLKIFYGGAVERISDFVSAFNLIHGAEDQARRDMYFALSAQDRILSMVDRAIAGNADNLVMGNIELPSEDFWRTCKNAILSLSVQTEWGGVSEGLVARLGNRPSPKREMDFGNDVMTGSALPVFLVKIETSYFPVALRNAPATVIQHWADKNNYSSAKNIADFVTARFQNVIGEPFRVVTRTERQQQIFSAAILDGIKPYLILALKESEISQLPKIQTDLTRAVVTGDWALQPVGVPEAVQLRSKDGVLRAIDQLVVIVVLSHLTTIPGALRLPKTKARVLPLPDFISIFDSVKDLDELDRFWAFVQSHSSDISGLSSYVDRFAAFRDSYAVLADGAVVPSMIILDPHWGSTWRYRMLKAYWDNAPPSLPDVPNTEWKVERDSDGLYRSEAKPFPALCWGAAINECAIHFMLVVNDQFIEVEDGRILELLVHCIADSINQRKSILASLNLFKYRQIITKCHANMDALVSRDDSDHSEDPLFSNWLVKEDSASRIVHVEVQTNLQRVQKLLADVVNASFEVEACVAWINGLTSCLGLGVVDSKVLTDLGSTSVRKPRFMLKLAQRTVDVPDYASPLVPTSEHYKLARRDLAIVFKDIGANEGKYELTAAKALIDPARDNFRALIHSRISALRRSELVQFCIQQLDMLIVKYDREQNRIKISLNHDVSYDRAKVLAEANERFVKESRNYRYLLECSLSISSSGSDHVSQEAVLQLVASIDWLLVLYGASDVLHNGLDVAGLELDHFFIPHVYYSEISDFKEAEFAKEAADTKLGLGMRVDDEVDTIQPSDTEWSDLDKAFKEDAGVSLNNFLSGLYILYRWPSAAKTSELRFSYSAPDEKVREVLIESIPDLTVEEADRIISLLSLYPKGIRRLLGKTFDESDVPVWEHNKRSDRYTIKPLIRDDKGILTWGAASVERAARIWRQNFANGYMPAEFEWPNVKEAVRYIKKCLDERLEAATFIVLSRATPYVEKGINFMHRFPNEKFDDVGDFDGLAYWPDANQWVSAECKHNQPAFCLKDARRLRDRIFGTPMEKEQLAKIEKRRDFLKKHLEQIRTLLHWPRPSEIHLSTVYEIYVSRDIYWWMRNPPYEVPTHFVRVDGLDNWLRDKGLLR